MSEFQEGDFYMAEVQETEDGTGYTNVTHIKKEDMKQLNDPNCTHNFVPDHEDETDFYVAMVCTLCPQGYLKTKNPTKK